MKNIDKQELHILFEGIKNNDKTSFDTLYEKYKSLVFGISFTVCRNNDIADEVTQNVFFKIWKLPQEKLPTSCEATWLYTITKNETIDILRKNTSYIDIDSIYNIANNENDISNIIDIDSYNRKISSLDEQGKQIVSLKLLSNFTFKEIGELLGIPTATVQWKYYKSLNYLKPILASLAIFIISFTIYIKSKITYNKNKMQSAEHAQSSTKSSESLQYNGESIGSQDIGFSTDSLHYSDSYTIQEKGLNKTSSYTIIFGFFSIFFLLCTIFAIFFKKYQQKRKSKTSKNCIDK